MKKYIIIKKTNNFFEIQDETNSRVKAFNLYNNMSNSNIVELWETKIIKGEQDG